MGLRYPSDLAAWNRSQMLRNPLRTALRVTRSSKSGDSALSGQLLLPAEEPTVLVVVDSWSPSCRLVLEEPLAHLDQPKVAVLTAIPEVLARFGPGRTSIAFTGVDQLPTSVDVVLSLGAYIGLGAVVEPWAKRSQRAFVVVQHGLMTPLAPPLNDGDHLLAWSAADADYWSAGRATITWDVVGSQLLWQAAHQSPVQLLDDRPVVLGQLHGTELPRASKQALYTNFCQRTGAQYRPHPNERDALSRLQHRVMRSAGVQFENSQVPVIDLGRPVVSIFSTGTLEAAYRGLPAWVHHPRPPAWIKEFWQRYGLAEYRQPPTVPQPLPEVEPAIAIAQAVQA